MEPSKSYPVLGPADTQAERLEECIVRVLRHAIKYRNPVFCGSEAFNIICKYADAVPKPGEFYTSAAFNGTEAIKCEAMGSLAFFTSPIAPLQMTSVGTPDNIHVVLPVEH